MSFSTPTEQSVLDYYRALTRLRRLLGSHIRSVDAELNDHAFIIAVFGRWLATLLPPGK